MHYRTTDGTAKTGTDYVKKTGVLTIPVGQMSANIDIKIRPAGTIHPPRAFCNPFEPGECGPGCRQSDGDHLNTHAAGCSRSLGDDWVEDRVSLAWTVPD